MYSISLPNQESKQPMTPFELKALAFADLIMAEANDEDSQNHIPYTNPQEEIKDEVPPFRAIRCICGDNQPTNRELFPCPNCHCYLHRDCIDPVEINSPNFQCPFCRLTHDGVDPFRELKSWIRTVNNELSTVHKLVTDALNYENQMYATNMGNEYQLQNMRGSRQGNIQSRNQLNRTITDIIQRITNITKL
ncbi:PHD finger protein 20 [Tritrichomonas musculus]|uniref:PHD finger protein 20 n=1 Tax=Tritrichomonas musculus TaxID=1915356 RepID=A0ABR2JT44_9EUKA